MSRYNEFRKQIQLPPVPDFETLLGQDADPEQLKALYQVYGTIDKLDLQVGVMAEGTRPECYMFGETVFQLFLLMATARIQNDRFLTTDYRPEVYTQQGIDWVESNTFKTVILRHFPDLANSELARVTNAFTPWN